jgi:hypothetical protein
MKTIHLRLMAIAIFLFSLLTACQRNNDSKPQNARIEIRLTDAPNTAVREVWVDIKDIQINIGDTSNWISLPNIHQGIYNLMELTDGRDTLLVDADIPAGYMNQMRLILGNNNYIITEDGLKEPLATPSAQESGLKLMVHSDITGGMLYRLTLDFDAGKSIVKAGNSGRYNLKPVIRVLSLVPSGGIVKGFVTPDSVMTSVFAIIGSDTIYSTSTFNGNYQFRDIQAGNYLLSFVPVSDSFNVSSATIGVQLGQTTIVDTIHLQHK